MTNNKINHRVSRLMIGTFASATTALGIVCITPQPAVASLDGAAQLLTDRWDDVVSYGWSPWNQQVYMTDLSRQEMEAVQNKHRSRANGVLHDRCVNKIADVYLSSKNRGQLSAIRRLAIKAANSSIKTITRWSVAMRVENGKPNCYLRMHNAGADEFIRKRGW